MRADESPQFEKRNGKPKVIRAVRRRRHILYNSLGILCVITGVVGIVVPVLPTTVFFIVASGIFITVNPQMYRWLHNNRVTGSYLRVYTQGEGMSRASKAWSVITLWLTLLVSAWFVRELPWLLLVLATVGVAVTWHIAAIKPRAISAETLERHRQIMDGFERDERRNA